MSLLDELTGAVVRKDDFGLIVGCDDRVTELFGWAPEDLVGQRSLDFIHPDDQRRTIVAWVDMLSSGADGEPSEWRHLHKEGSYVWVSCVNRNLLESHGYIESQMRRITGRRDGRSGSDASVEPRPGGASLIASVMGEQEWLLQRLAQSLPIGVALIDHCGSVDFVNQRMRTLVGASTTTTDLLMRVTPPCRPTLMMELERAFSEGSDADVELEFVNRQSQLVSTCSVNVRPLDPQPAGVSKVLLCVQDVTESSKLREQLVIRATVDALTGCLNRGSTLEMLGDLLERGHPLAVLFIDVNGLKAVNDRSGHAGGDALLTDIGGCLRSAARSDDVVGRIGGDEFLVLCPGIADSETALRLSCRYAEVIRERWPRRPGEEPVLSIGVAHTADGRISADQLVAAADTAMYRAKSVRAALPVLAPPEGW